MDLPIAQKLKNSQLIKTEIWNNDNRMEKNGLKSFLAQKADKHIA